MESELPSQGPVLEVFEALGATEPIQATEALSKLAELLHSRGADGLDLLRVWDSFQQLLDRRGYFVNSPAALAESLREIQAVGPGFDLYDLAQSLARYDVARARCLKISGSRTLPELEAFAPNCGCSKHRKEKGHA